MDTRLIILITLSFTISDILDWAGGGAVGGAGAGRWSQERERDRGRGTVSRGGAGGRGSAPALEWFLENISSRIV